MIYDYIVIGGGIVGISTAWQLQQRFTDKTVLLLEKETSMAQHQTSHNSGVIHAGVYYAPGSLKATFCKQGMQATIDFCQQHDISYQRCGKLLIATSEEEVKRMHDLHQRCLKNDISAQLLNTEQLKEREPNVVGLAAIFVKDSAIVNYQQIAEKMAECFRALGGHIQLEHEVVAIKESSKKVSLDVKHKGKNLTFDTAFLITCSGLMADRVTKMLGIKTDFQIIPFRGEYYQLPAKYNEIVKHLIYPIPNPELPFLGVHLTRMIDGTVTVGPNAVQGWKREGYAKVNFSLKDTAEMISFSGFWHLLRKNLKTGLIETKNSLYKPGYLELVRKYCPSIELDDLQPYPAGIRAQAVLKDGSLVHDFLFAQSPRSLNVCNAPSPAATSAIPIGQHIIEKMLELNQKY